jgi:fructosamine-3-kinase
MDEVEKKLVEEGICSHVKRISSNCLETNVGNMFVKFGTGGSTSIDVKWLEYEYLGLQKMSQATSSLHVPKPYLVGTSSSGKPYLVAEYIDFKHSSKSSTKTQQNLGLGLADMHLAPTEYRWFGFPMDGCCGALAQLNNVEQRSLTWVEFWREYRLGFQLKIAKDNYPELQELHEKGEQLMKYLPELFSMLVVEDIKPSLLHGDLWSGNYSVDTKGVPCIFDPACYYGHDEADLGIARMFGGFSSEFFSSYHSKIPKRPGYEKRVLLYELHHHLNHLNIFGTSYSMGALGLMNRILSKK